MSTVFLFGAGASYGSGPCKPDNPPLGNDFFTEFKKLGGIASTVSTELEDLFCKDFEKGMDAFFEQRNKDVSEFLRDMAKYFCQFTPLEGNLYCEVIKIIGGDRKKATFVTTNYDVLIEVAAGLQGMGVTYNDEPTPPKQVKLFKIHGSCNFLPDMGNRAIRGVTFGTTDFPGAILEAPVIAVQSAREVINFCDTEDAIAPAIAMYMPSKRALYCKQIIETQRKAWMREAFKAKRIYIIGLRVHEVDDHIWGVLAKTKCELYFVGGGHDTFLQWASKNNRKNSRPIAENFNEALPIIAKHLRVRWKPRSA